MTLNGVMVVILRDFSNLVALDAHFVKMDEDIRKPFATEM